MKIQKAGNVNTTIGFAGFSTRKNSNEIKIPHFFRFKNQKMSIR
jgi:hypothetical protein